MSEKLIDIGSLKICYETFGSAKHEPILLIMGTGLQGILWSDDFCKALADNHFYVIRYDHRDTGLSTCVDYDKEPYTLMDLANDALKLLDKLNIKKAHMIGMSMGGHLVQLIAIHHPERLITATLIMSTPHHMVFLNAVLFGKDTPNTSLPKPSQELCEFFSTTTANLDDRENAIAYALATWKLFNGNKAEFDKQYWRPLLTLQFERAKHPYARNNHRQACLASPEDRAPLLKQVHVPILIIHGTEDPIFPLEHGKTLENIIPNSKLLVIENMGHALNPLFQDTIINAIVTHINNNA
jgi:pimeloyl-ACP methyl ester carboxylesterase